MNGVTAVEAKILHAHKMNYSPLPQLMYIPQGLPVPGVIILWDLHDRFQLRDAMDHPRLWTLHERIGMNFSENSVRRPVETERNGDIPSKSRIYYVQRVLWQNGCSRGVCGQTSGCHTFDAE